MTYRPTFVNRLSTRVSGQFFESLTVLLTVCLTFLLTRARDVDEFFEKITVKKNKKSNRRKEYDRRKNDRSF
jgi:hypothetical protein